MMDEWSYDREKTTINCMQAQQTHAQHEPHHGWGGQPSKLEGCQEGFQIHQCFHENYFERGKVMGWRGGETF